mmetsp:Transcript_23499/g.61131  ORF Transcript_23499/g.61131 Transcript_23499/m.61131 type:complete len:227 (-) Transcript_23499:953-1633(-)
MMRLSFQLAMSMGALASCTWSLGCFRTVSTPFRSWLVTPDRAASMRSTREMGRPFQPPASSSPPSESLCSRSCPPSPSSSSSSASPALLASSSAVEAPPSDADDVAPPSATLRFRCLRNLLFLCARFCRSRWMTTPGSSEPSTMPEACSAWTAPAVSARSAWARSRTRAGKSASALAAMCSGHSSTSRSTCCRDCLPILTGLRGVLLLRARFGCLGCTSTMACIAS